MEGIMMKYFVLKPRSKTINDDYAFASRKAMQTFANNCNDRQLSDELRAWVDLEERRTRLMINKEKDNDGY